MKNILSYDSKLITMLALLADTMILNLLFLLCCLPIVTIGAATTALFSGCRALAEETPCFRAFFRALKTSFLRATAAWLIEFAAVFLFAWCAWVLWVNQFSSYLPAFLVSILVLLLLLAVTNMTLLFYSKFECTLSQLLKNGLYMTLGHLLRAILMGLAMWAPLLMFFLLPDTFWQLAIVWLALYFGTIANLCVRIMKKPFARIAEQAGSPAPQNEQLDQH